MARATWETQTGDKSIIQEFISPYEEPEPPSLVRTITGNPLYSFASGLVCATAVILAYRLVF
jgi:hypothetical protein